MKTYNIIYLLILGFLVLQPLKGQSDCKVLKSEISIEYKGDCKDGFAHGEGEAFGIDHYIGHFKKGYPDGVGTFSWSTGEVYKGQWKRGMRHGKGEYSFFANRKDTTIVGKWVKDKYVGSEKGSSSYKITYKNNIGRVTVVRMGPGSQVRCKFLRHGGELAVGNLMFISDSGTTSTFRQFTGFEHIEFPLKAKVTFSVPNDFNTAILNCELSFIIYEPGSYELSIFP